jgi:glycosyltransferase involved in cell wall biosynthesis
VSDPAPAPSEKLTSLGYSILILTFNEEAALPGCLASIKYCDDIVVLDSGSTDRTLAIAREAGVRIHERPFDSFARQRNYAQREISFRHPWVLHLDADERLTCDFWTECGGVLDSPEVDGFHAATKILWRGKWVRRSSRFPQQWPRLVRAPAFQFVDGPKRAREAAHMRMDELFCCPLNDASIRGEAALLERHRRYAETEARFHHETPARHALPFRPARLLFNRYVLCGGFLDGRAGWSYCRELARYESLTAAAQRRLRAAAGARQPREESP